MLGLLICFSLSVRRGMEVIKSPAKAELQNSREKVLIRLNEEEDDSDRKKFYGAVVHGIRQDTPESNIAIRLNEENEEENADSRILIRLNEEEENADGRILIRLNENDGRVASCKRPKEGEELHVQAEESDDEGTDAPYFEYVRPQHMPATYSKELDDEDPELIQDKQ